MIYAATIFLLVLAIYFVVSGQRVWRASKFYLKFGHITGADDSYLIEPPPMMGSVTLRIDMVGFAEIPKNWKKVKKCIKLFFWKKNQDDFFALDSNFTIQIKHALSNEPLLVGAFLPSWNLNGTNRDKVIFPQALKLDLGAMYKIALWQNEKNKFTSFFKIDGGAVYKGVV